MPLRERLDQLCARVGGRFALLLALGLRQRLLGFGRCLPRPLALPCARRTEDAVPIIVERAVEFLRAAAIDLGLLTGERFDELVKPEDMIGPGT